MEKRKKRKEEMTGGTKGNMVILPLSQLKFIGLIGVVYCGPNCNCMMC
jgi:hypothetical protein